MFLDHEISVGVILEKDHISFLQTEFIKIQ